MNLSGAKFEYADLSFANLRGCNLSGASLKNVTMTHSDMSDCDFTDTDLSFADMKYAVSKNSYFNKTKFYKADIEKGVLSASTFDDIVFDETKMKYINFSYSKFKNTQWIVRGTINNSPEPIAAKIISDANFTNSDLSGLDLSGYYLINTIFDEANLQDFKSVSSHISNCSFKGSNLKNSNLSKTLFASNNFPPYIANSSFVDFSESNLSNTNFSESNLSGAIWNDGRICQLDNNPNYHIYLVYLGLEGTDSINELSMATVNFFSYPLNYHNLGGGICRSTPKQRHCVTDNDDNVTCSYY